MNDKQVFDFGEALRHLKCGKCVTCDVYRPGSYLKISNDNLLQFTVIMGQHPHQGSHTARWEPFGSLLQDSLLSNTWRLCKPIPEYTVKYYEATGRYIMTAKLWSDGDAMIDVINTLIHYDFRGYNKSGIVATIEGEGVNVLVTAPEKNNE